MAGATRFVRADAFRWLEEQDDVFDVVIVDLPDPRSFSLGKLYTTSFYALLKAHPLGYGPLRVVRKEPFIGIPYLSTLGFRRERPMPRLCLSVAHAMERALGAARGVAATRALLVWEKGGTPPAP